MGVGYSILMAGVFSIGGVCVSLTWLRSIVVLLKSDTYGTPSADERGGRGDGARCWRIVMVPPNNAALKKSPNYGCERVRRAWLSTLLRRDMMLNFSIYPGHFVYKSFRMHTSVHID